MKLQSWIETLQGSATLVEDLMASLEAVLVSTVGRIACWLAPLPSAVLVSRAAGRVFDLDGWWAIVMAMVVELVGLVTSNLWLTAKEWNENKRKSDPEANERLALALMIGYFVTAIALLLAFEIPHVVETGSIVGLTSLLFPGLSAVGVIALNERVTHYRRVAEIRASKAKKRKRSAQKRRTGQAQQMPSRPAQTSAQIDVLDTVNRTRRERKAARLNALMDAFRDDPDLGATEAARLLGVHRNTIYSYIDELEEAGRITRKNGRVEMLEV